MTIRRAKGCKGSRDGIALLAVLAFILLLTILIVGFISFARLNRLSTVSYGRSVEADEIAKGGLQDIISDLHAEIIAGSKKDPTGTTYTQPTATGTTVYVPATNSTAVPARIGYPSTSYGTDTTTTTLSPTLVRVSRATNNPKIVGGDSFFTNLTANKGPYTNNITAVPGGTILNRASLAYTSTSSYNGRSISPARWNKTVLLAPNASSVPSPFTTAPPDWVYVTRTGSRVCTSGEVTSGALSASASVTQTYTAPVAGQNPVASPVLGRYAFAIYDEGALLDANAAGYTSTAAVAGVSYSDPTTGIVQAVNGKSFLSYADLTQLPGLSGVATAQTVVDNFVNWRNASAATAVGTPIAGADYLKAMFTDSLKGFMMFQSNTTTGASDSPLLERQDLVNYFANLDASGGTSYSSVLPYLGTFTRAVVAPSYSPPNDYTSIGPATPAPKPTASTAAFYKYKTNAELSTQSPFSSTRTPFKPPTPLGLAPDPTTSPGRNPNRDLPNVRFPSTVTPGTVIIHYNDDTTPVKYAVNPGDPLLQTRFSLARIGWLSSSSIGGADPAPGGANPGDPTSKPSSNYATAIQSCFGLQWGTTLSGAANGGNPCWTYVGSNGGNTPAGSIETLDQVATENREPNFFELLKAAILAGSLGVNAGVTAWQNGGAAQQFDFKGSPAYTGGVDGLYAYSLDSHSAGVIPSVPAPNLIPDVQIMKIGADIIDQYDADSYPTAIYFQYYAIDPTHPIPSQYDAAQQPPANAGLPDHMLYGEANMVYGDENLPYLTGIYTLAGTLTPDDKQGMNGWVQPEIWNPHQMPASFPSQAPLPSNFQIRAYGQADLAWSYEPEGGSNISGSSQTAIPSPGQLDGSYINITYSNPTSHQLLYPTPWAVVSNFPGITCAPAGVNSTLMTPTTMTEYSQNEFVGFWLGNDLLSANPYQVYLDSQAMARVNTECTGSTYALGWLDQNQGFHPYSFIVSPIGFSYGIVGQEKNNGVDPSDTTSASNTGSAVPSHTGDDAHVAVDPRTTRYCLAGFYQSDLFGTTFYKDNTVGDNHAGSSIPVWGAPYAQNFKYTANFHGDIPLADWETNSPNPLGTTLASKTYYADLDGIIRPGDGIYCNPSTGDGTPLFTSNGSPTGTETPYAAGDSGNVSHGRRPVILNRPFRSVAEMGYAYRDLPFKTLDFFSTYSADAALLDVFSLTDETKVSNQVLTSIAAGQFNPSNAPLPVIQSVLAGGSKKDFDTSYNMSAEVPALAAQIAADLNPTTGTGPLLSRADLVTVISPTLLNSFKNSGDLANKAYLEAPIRALSDVTNTRTWNLMIDVIAQSGQMAPSAKTLDDFVVQSERRYWLHVAIDRYTGKIVAQQLEPVYE